MTKSHTDAISFFRWEDDACRLHNIDGVLTADIYRSGKGFLPISPVDLLFGAVEISEESYKELVLQEMALRKSNG